MAWSLDTPEGVMHLQRGLNYAVWYTGVNFNPVSGVMDADTTESVQKFQSIFDMVQTGIVTNSLMDKLEAEMVRKNITEW
jgi:hypothetical protein